MKKYCTLILLFFSFISFAQGIALEAGYKYKYTNALATGLSYRVSKNNIKNPINLNVGVVTNFSNNNMISVGVQKRFKEFLEYGVNLTNKDLEPTFGVNFINLAKLNLGYSFAYAKNRNSGFTFGLTIAIAEDKYYDNIPIGW